MPEHDGGGECDGGQEHVGAAVMSRMATRRRSLNQIRSLLLERGVRVAQGFAKLRELQGASSPVSPRIQLLLRELHDRLLALTQRIRAFNAEFTAQAQVDERARRLMAIPGIGTLNATALVAAPLCQGR